MKKNNHINHSKQLHH